VVGLDRFYEALNKAISSTWDSMPISWPMEKESFQDDSFAEYLNDNYISIRVDVDKEQNIAEKYDVFALPTTYFISSSGENLGSVPGYLSTDRLMEILKKI
jgi:thioredoxin-related protein